MPEQAYELYDKEISYVLPSNIPTRYLVGGRHIFNAYGCALLERQTEKGYVYSAVNLSNGKSETICRKAAPIDSASHARLAAKIRALPFRGAGVYEVDRLSGEHLAKVRLQEILNHVFTGILPRYGYIYRENQLGLAEHMLETISSRGISLAESEVARARRWPISQRLYSPSAGGSTISGCTAICQTRAIFC